MSVGATTKVIDGRTRRRVENHARIFDAAMTLLSKHKYEDVSIEDICSAANVGRATFFRVYKTKSDLFVEFNRRLAERVQQRLDEKDWRTVEQALRLVGNEITETWVQAVPGAAALAMDFSETARTREPHAGELELLNIIVAIVDRGLKDGELKSTLPSSLVGSLALVQIATPVSYWFRNPKRDLGMLIDEAIDHWLHGSIKKPHQKRKGK